MSAPTCAKHPEGTLADGHRPGPRPLLRDEVLSRKASTARPLLRDEGDVAASSQEQIDQTATVELKTKPDAVLAVECIRELLVETLSEVTDVHIRVEVENGSVVVELDAHGGEPTGARAA